VAVCLLIFSSEDSEPVRRAVARATVSLHDACVTSNVVVEELGTSGIAFVPIAAFLSRGVAAVRVPTALGLLASASLFFSVHRRTSTATCCGVQPGATPLHPFLLMLRICSVLLCFFRMLRRAPILHPARSSCAQL